ncbi:MAG TPA: hypothetical protein PKD10_06455 [Paracoccaceae bacterium]|nr:hypothetical protein [Paracoccaceae bacterium]HMO71480.1 hypothetical protein [Paracoccaceae bacterium]
MARKKVRESRARAARGAIGAMLAEYALMIGLVLAMGLGVAMVLWAVFDLALLTALAAGLAFAVVGGLVMWFAG